MHASINAISKSLISSIEMQQNCTHSFKPKQRSRYAAPCVSDTYVLFDRVEQKLSFPNPPHVLRSSDNVYKLKGYYYASPHPMCCVASTMCRPARQWRARCRAQAQNAKICTQLLFTCGKNRQKESKCEFRTISSKTISLQDPIFVYQQSA